MNWPQPPHRRRPQKVRNPAPLAKLFFTIPTLSLNTPTTRLFRRTYTSTTQSRTYHNETDHTVIVPASMNLSVFFRV